MQQSVVDGASIYEVVVNSEGQYSFWSVGKGVPKGWTKVGHQGEKSSCLDYINRHWVDMRPKSLVKSLNTVEA